MRKKLSAIVSGVSVACEASRGALPRGGTG